MILAQHYEGWVGGWEKGTCRWGVGREEEKPLGEDTR